MLVHSSSYYPPSPVSAATALPKEKSAVVQLFQNSQVYNHFPNNAELDNRTYTLGKVPPNLYSSSGGIAAGNLACLLSWLTIPEVALHEIVGHGMLGYGLVYQKDSLNPPQYQVDGIDNLKALINAQSFQERVQEFGNFISGYDRNQDGAAGYATISNPKVNALGAYLGPDATSAWVSLAGSLPCLAINTLSITGGMHLKEKSPFLGYFLMTYGLLGHINASAYPISAALMNSDTIASSAMKGHDFANFAVRMSRVTGWTPQNVAITTAAAYSAVVPIAALVTYLYQKAHETEIVPDMVALRKWLVDSSNNADVHQQLNDYLENYPNKEALITLMQRASKVPEICVKEHHQLQEEMLKFFDYLLEKLPRSTIESVKREVLKDWDCHQVKDNIQVALTITSTLATITSIATKGIELLAVTVAPSLSTAATICSYASPLLAGVSVITSGYDTYKSLRSSDTTNPISAKLLSIAKLVVAVATAVIITIALFIPGLNALLIGTILIGGLLNATFSFAQTQIIKKRFALLQALQPETCQQMQYRMRYDPQNKSVIKWQELVKEAKAAGI